MSTDDSSNGGQPPDRDLTQTVSDGSIRSTSATDKSVDLGDRAMKARLAQRMFGADVTPPRIGRYRIERRVGAGGMGVVYEGFDEQLERRVAIKLLHPELDERHAIRMRREALALAKMSHPNVVHAYEIGVHDGSLFLVMEFIAGEPLSKWQRAHRQHWKAILEKYLEAGQGLAAAHAAGIVHRDFKPSNVVVCNEGPARVLDFGLARSFGAILDAEEQSSPLTDPGSALDARVTVTGTTMGTPAYMSPEQMLGRPTNAASDQFSFCVALYEGLYGERPFVGENAAELYESLMFERIRPPPAASRVPKRVRAVVLRGLRTRPEQRYASMQDLLRALEGPMRPGKWRPVVALGIVGVSSTAWVLGTREPPCTDGAEGATRVWTEHRSEVSAAFADVDSTETMSGIDDRITRYATQWADDYREACALADESTRRRALACLEGDQAALASMVALLAAGGEAVGQSAFHLIDELPPSSECHVTSQESDAHQRAALVSARLDAVAGRTEAARTTVAAVLDEARRAGSNASVADALFALALIEAEDANYRDATALLQDAVAEGLIADTPLLVADAWIELARVESRDASTLDDAREHLRNARSMLQRHAGSSERVPGDRAARVASVEGEQAFEAGDLESAESKLRAAVEGFEAAHDAQHKLVTQAQLKLAHVLAARGKSQEALELYDAGRTAMAEVAGPNYPWLWAFDYGIALVHFDLGELDNAHARLMAALGLIADAGPAWAEQRGQVLVALAQMRLGMNRMDEALESARAAKAELAPVLPPEHPHRRNAEGLVAAIRLAHGDLEGGAEALRTLAAGHEAASDLRMAAEVRASLVTIELRRDRPGDAAAVLQRHRAAIAERFGAEKVRVLEDAIAAMQALAAGEKASGRAGLERVREAIDSDEVGSTAPQWCDVRAWATLALARSLATDDPARAQALAAEAKAHLTEMPHDPGLLAEIDAFVGS